MNDFIAQIYHLYITLSDELKTITSDKTTGQTSEATLLKIVPLGYYR